MEFRWMTFVDGENLTIEGEKVAKSDDIKLIQGDFWRPREFLWFPVARGSAWSGPPEPNHATVGNAVQRYIGNTEVRLAPQGIRATYYTAVQGSDPDLTVVEETIWKMGFDPAVFKKPKGRASKGVDITMTRDVLTHAFQGNLDLVVLMTGDADYIPLVEEVKRLGKRVHISFFGEGQGLSPELRRAADSFDGDNLTRNFLKSWREYSDWVQRGSPTD